MNIVEAVRNLLIHVPATTDAEALKLLEGLAGRGEDQYGPRLRNWLGSNPDAFPEFVDVDAVDHVRDSGVDVILAGRASGARVGFQIKSDNDLAGGEFTREVKAQITDARAWGLSLYVIILACRPTKKNFDKYMHLMNEIGRSPDDFVRILMPARAAGLLRAFDSPLPTTYLVPRSWTDFFTAVGQYDLVSRHLDDWNGVLPDDRFQPPKEWDAIVEAVRATPLTVVTGPPAVGKTFCALQVLWREFQAGREVKWITPARFIETEGPISEQRAPADMKRRIDLLTRYLGIIPRQPPLDSTEFIAAHLRPDTTVYIEDPFGKTDDEFSYSMHTFRFFDLDKFVAAISEGAERYGCRILLTSRESLFERWLAEREQRGFATPKFALRHVTRNSYELDQRLALSRRLVASRDVADVEGAATAVAKQADIPFDVDLIVRSLPQGASDEQVAHVVRQLQGDYAEKLRHQIVADTDAERLFLLLLVALREPRIPDRTNFHRAFTDLHGIIGIPGDAGENLKRAETRYRSFVSRTGVTVLERVKSGKGVSFNRRKDATAYHLESVHSTVVDAITHHLRDTAAKWLEEVSASLRTPAIGYASRPAQAKIALLFISWGLGRSKGAAQEGMLKAIFDKENGSLLRESQLMFMWKFLPADFKEGFFNYLEERDLAEASSAGSLLNVIRFPPEDAWRLLGLLATKPGMGVGLFNMYGGHPWGYLATHLCEIPPALRATLNRVAEKQPSLFSYALSGVLIERWDEIPQEWRDALLHPTVLEDKHAREKFLLALARNWRELDPVLKDLFRTQAKSKNYEIRSMVAISALVYHEVDPAEMEPIYTATLHDEVIYVPLRVFDEIGDDEHDRRFAEALFERAGEAAAADMLGSLLYRGEMKVDWKIKLAEACVTKGGEFSRGVLAYQCLDNGRTEFMGYRLAGSPESEPEPVRLAWVWAHINSEGKRPTLADDLVISLIKGLSPQYRYLVLFYLSVQANYLPHPIDYYVEGLRASSEDDKKAIQEGADDRQPPGGSRTLYGFPVRQLVDD